MAGVVDTCYISCGCNRTPHCADWGRNGLVCYGACRAVAIYEAKKCQVYVTLTGHTERVQCVRWLSKPNNEAETELVSGSSDSTAIIWKQNHNGQFHSVATLSGQCGAITVVSGLYRTTSDGGTTHLETLVATAATDSTVWLWVRQANSDDFSHVQSISLDSGFALALAWTLIPNTRVPLLAWGGDDGAVHILTETQKQSFGEVLSLRGHVDWVRGLDFTIDDTGDILLASCSQDCYVRVWRMSPSANMMSNRQFSDLRPGEEIVSRELRFEVTTDEGEKPAYFAVKLEAVLHGHENWVYSIQWQPHTSTAGCSHQPLCLLSASMDKTMIIWKPDSESGIWVEQVRVGDVGGNSLGFYGGVFSPDGTAILAHGYQGALQMWKEAKDSWQSVATPSGHFDTVEDVSWEPTDGQFIVSVSHDQTTRLHSCCQLSPVNKDITKVPGSWHEIARPQIHGYDLQCVTMISQTMFVSAADEKLLRVFQAPRNFIENFSRLCGEELIHSDCDLPEGASVSALGLSNKAVYAGKEANTCDDVQALQPTANPQYVDAYFAPLSLTEPPTEGDLMQNTLWPEVQKLYGHGYEVYAVAAHPGGKLIASACKATTLEHGAIMLWNDTWQHVSSLLSHSLTVTQMAFSHDGRRLLSISRDRTWAVFQQKSDTGISYERVAHTDKKTSIHGRVIWSCAWSHDDRYFVTVSRDKKAVVWGFTTNRDDAGGCLGDYEASSSVLQLTDSITAVDFASVQLKSGCYLLAFGLENGHLYLYGWSAEIPQTSSSWSMISHLDQRKAHHLAVKRLRFRPCTGEVGSKKKCSNTIQLASVGADHMLKIHTIYLDRINK